MFYTQRLLSGTFLTLMLAGSTLYSQVPLNDRLKVTFPNEVRVGSQTIPPGEYTIRQLPTASNPRLLEFSSDQGTKLQAAVTTIAALDNNNRKETMVELEQRGGQYHVHRIWIQGKSYGYEIPVEEGSATVASTTSREMRLSARFEPTPVVVAQAAPPPAPEPTPAPVVAPAPVVVEPAPAPVVVEPAQEAPPVVAQAQPPAEPEPAPAPRETPPMPSTSMDWSLMVVCGLVMLAGGLLIDRLQRAR